MSGKPVVIFGVGQLAELAHFYFNHDSERVIAGFTVDADFLPGETHAGLPAIAFEEVRKRFPPSEYDLFLPISFKQMNAIRRDRFNAAKDMGYDCPSYVSTKATTWPNLDVGQNCFIFEDNTIQPFVRVGDNCILWSGNHIGHHSVIEDHVFITSQVVVSGACRIGAESFLGVNATIRDETVIAPRSLIGMGAGILRDTEEGDVWLAPRAEKAEADSRVIGRRISPARRERD
jgi:sugar O-acyltransferase (sialic acid O-acetyltransferase NeuD family)